MEQLEEVAEVSDILANHDDFLTPAVRQECQQHLPDTSQIESRDAEAAYLYLKSHVNRSAFWVIEGVMFVFILYTGIPEAENANGFYSFMWLYSW